MDYYTNSRYTLDQELEADLFALRVMKECGLKFDKEETYRNVLQILERENITKSELKTGIDPKIKEKILN